MNTGTETKKQNGYQDPVLEIKVDVFKENVYGAIAGLLDLAERMGVDIKKDSEHTIVKMYHELLEMRDKAYQYETIAEVDEADDRLIEIQKYCASMRKELK